VTRVEKKAREFVRDLIEEYLKTGRGFLRHQARLRLRDFPGLFDSLAGQGVIIHVGTDVAPTVSAFEYIADKQLEEYAVGSVDIVLRALYSLYEEKGLSSYPGEDVVAAALKRAGADPTKVRLGIWLIQEFKEYITHYVSIQNETGYAAKEISVGDSIAELDGGAAAWKRLAERHISLKRSLAVQSAASVGPPTSASATFSFLRNGKLRLIVEHDYDELQRIATVEAPKAEVVLCGGLIEALVLHQLVCHRKRAIKSKKAKPGPIERWDFRDLIEVAIDLRLMTSSAHKLSNFVREYRNLVHPGRQWREGIRIRREEADVARSILNLVIKDIRDSSVRSKRRPKRP